MRCGTIVYRNADGSPGEAVDFVADDAEFLQSENLHGTNSQGEFFHDVGDKTKPEPADEVIDWLLEEFLEYRKKQGAGSTL